MWVEVMDRAAAGSFNLREASMRTPYGLNILDNCVTCPAKGEHLFCNLSLQASQRLNEIKSTALYPKGAMLFIEGQIARGVFVLCSGKVKLSTTSREGKTIITKISDTGDVLGLNAVTSNVPYEVTAEMMEPGQANFIPRDSLQLFVKEFPEVSMRVAQQLSRNYYCAYEEIRTLGLAASPSEKFAKLLLTWSTKSSHNDGSSQVKLTLTHEEIAEIIGTTRETVSRLFSEFKKKQLMQAKGATLLIRSRFALEKIVQSY
jgi:CRP/FNR family transcriptional regulator, cyclic AMP receptor protein